MDIFKFNNPTDPTRMEQGEIINGLKSKLWVERYRDAGEFKLTADADKRLLDALPVGSFISHTNSKEIMIVEDHEINDEKSKEAELTITGRGLEVFADHRIVGSNQTYPTTGGIAEYSLAWANLAVQIRNLLRDHLLIGDVVNNDDAFPYLEIIETVVGGTTEVRTLQIDSLYSHTLKLLEIDDLGIRVIRPGPWSPAVSAENTVIEIHEGVSRANEIIFSNDTGEIESADYFWSNRKKKNAAYVYGRWVDTVVLGPETEYDRRMMMVDASDLDQSFTAAPTGTDRTNILNKMTARGNEALANQNDISLVNAEASENAKTWRYRHDYDVGDIVTVVGNYNESAPFRISEFVEVEDEYGFSGYPSLTPYIP